jgi:hypothetical protein
MTAFTLLQMSSAGCHQLQYITKRLEVVDGYKLQLCESGCPDYHDGTCPAYLELVSQRPLSDTNVIFSNTVAEEAKRLGLTKSEVRRRRSKI